LYSEKPSICVFEGVAARAVLVPPSLAIKLNCNLPAYRRSGLQTETICDLYIAEILKRSHKSLDCRLGQSPIRSRSLSKSRIVSKVSKSLESHETFHFTFVLDELTLPYEFRLWSSYNPTSQWGLVHGAIAGQCPE